MNLFNSIVATVTRQNGQSKSLTGYKAYLGITAKNDSLCHAYFLCRNGSDT